MAIKLHISPRIIPSISTLYNDVNRIFMEYVDNSIDSADQYWYSQEKLGYERPIEIRVHISGHSYKDGMVTISDNCYGITNFTKVVESIGDSDKKSQRFTNGQFGFGIFSFMAACDSLDVSSKEKEKEALHLALCKSLFDEKRVEDVKINEPDTLKKFPVESGTIMRLSDFDKDHWKTISAKILKEEIEKHFERILSRKNLSVIVIDENGSENVCEAFDYNKFDGEVYEDYIEHLDLEGGRRFKTLETITIKPPVHIYLKMTKGLSLNKPTVFVSKGRRICEVKEVKSFKSQHRNDIWGHPIVTGFIDLGDLLGPTIARNDFKSDKNSKALFQELIAIEEAVSEFVRRANQHTEDRHYQQLEDVLNQALSKLARQYSMKYRTDYLTGKKVGLAGGGLGMGAGDDFGDIVPGDGDEIINPDDTKEPVDDGTGLTDDSGKLPSDNVGGENPKNEEKPNDNEFAGDPKKRSGFNIRITEGEPQKDETTGKLLRSMYDGDSIIIYKNHPDFQARVSHSRGGETKITERLISYLSSEITVHYKDLFYKKQQNGQPEYNKAMFEGMVEFIYSFENMLQDFQGKNLSELS
jgi:hypothetical protein